MDIARPDIKNVDVKSSWTSSITFKNVSWWILLVIAVLVVPCIAYTFTTMVHVTGGSEVVVFVIACWVCVFIGLALMKEPYINSIMFENIALPAMTKQHCIGMIHMVESEVAKWKKTHEQCEAIFMNLSKQPAWGYIDENVQVLSAIKQSLSENGNISFAQIKALSGWIDSAKSSVIEGYLHSLEASYGYAKAEYAQQGKDIDKAFPDLANGNIRTFVKAPLFATTYSRELWNVLEKEHPFVGRFMVNKASNKKVA